MKTWIVIFSLSAASLLAQDPITYRGSHRILTMYDVARFLKNKLELSQHNTDADRDCTSFSRELNLPIALGVVVPENDGPLIDELGQVFFEWYINCMARVVEHKLREDFGPINTERFLGENFISFQRGQRLRDIEWRNIPKAVQESIVKTLLFRLVGPSFMLEQLRYTGDDSVFMGQPQDEEALVQILITRLDTVQGTRESAYSSVITLCIWILSFGEILIY